MENMLFLTMMIVFASCTSFDEIKEDAVRNDFHPLIAPSIIWNNDEIGLEAEFIAVHYSYVPFTSVGIGAGGGIIFSDKKLQNWWLGVTPYAGVIIPFSSTVQFFADALSEIGFTQDGGVIEPVPGLTINPGFDFGMRIGYPDKEYAMEIIYKGKWHPHSKFVNSFGIVFLCKRIEL
jgi:hypothetical protein